MKGGKIKEYLLKYGTLRIVVQSLSFIFLSAVVFNLGALPLVLPVLWTWGLSQNTVGDAFTVIQLNFYNAVFPWLAFASFLIVGILIGKSMCGWVCPFGFVQDLVDFAKRRKRDFTLRTHDNMLYVKYAILGIALFISVTFAAAKTMDAYKTYEKALGVFAKAPFTALSPAETLFSALPQMVANLPAYAAGKSAQDILAGITAIPIIFWPQLAILIGVLVVAALVPRVWCKYFCPHGAIMAIMNRFSFIGLRRDPVKCAKGGCRLCVNACPMRVPILDLPWEKFSHQECIYCMKCVDACKDKAIRPTYP